ncbi:MAG: hypothetical protein WC264_03085 [Candidatus Paceibacterota bacterium]|jgi:hypothetical protein
MGKNSIAISAQLKQYGFTGSHFSDFISNNNEIFEIRNCISMEIPDGEFGEKEFLERLQNKGLKKFVFCDDFKKYLKSCKTRLLSRKILITSCCLKKQLDDSKILPKDNHFNHSDILWIISHLITETEELNIKNMYPNIFYVKQGFSFFVIIVYFTKENNLCIGKFSLGEHKPYKKDSYLFLN